jgi:hypothetical protein
VLKSRVLTSVISGLFVLSLTACEKPNPGITVWSGTDSEHSEAVCWTDQDAITPTDCAQDIIDSALASKDVATVSIMTDQTVGISVDPDVADLGWYVAIGGQRFNDAPIFETYYRFTFPKVSIPEGGYDMQVIAQGKGSATRGIWVFKLVNAAGK